ncbi:putative RNA-binding protein 15B [Nelusetta ayraudi]|uniref:putative RNA-binding protein 15B n=1 Tax=Nelusetta ayraudi TaxID=303726 RepID=UPI003F6F5D06
MKRQAGKDGSPSRGLAKRPRERESGRREEPKPPSSPLLSPAPAQPPPLALLLAESRGYHRRRSRSRERDKPRLREERGAASLELQQHQHRAGLSLLGRPPLPAVAPPRPGTLEYKTLLISNLGAHVEDEHVEDALFHDFKKFGDVSVKLSHTPELGRVAYVNFRRPEDAREARRAKSSSRLLLGERQLRVEPVYVRRRSATPPDGGYPPLQTPGPSRDIRDLRELRELRARHYGLDRERLLDYYGLLEARGRSLLDERGRGLLDERGRGLLDERGRGLLLEERGRGLLDERGRGLLDERARSLLERGRGLLLEERGRGLLLEERGRGLPGGRGLPVAELAPEDDQRATSNLFVGGLAAGVTEAELRRDFGRFGAIEGVVIKRPAVGGAGGSGGGVGGGAYAFVKFRDLDMAHRAKVAMQGRLVGGNPVRIGYGKATPTTRLWVGGLGGAADGSGGATTTLAALARELDRFGAIRSIRLVGGGGRRGAEGEDGGGAAAYVQFESLDAARAACAQMRGFTLGGGGAGERRLRVDYAREEEEGEGGPGGEEERKRRKKGRGRSQEEGEEEELSPSHPVAPPPPTSSLPPHRKRESRGGRARSPSPSDKEEEVAPPPPTSLSHHRKALARPLASLERESQGGRARSPSHSDEERRRGRGHGAPPTSSSSPPSRSSSLERESRGGRARSPSHLDQERRRGGRRRGHGAPPPPPTSPPSPSSSSSPRAPDSTTAELRPSRSPPSPSSDPAPSSGPTPPLEVWCGCFSLKSSNFPTRLLLLEGQSASFLPPALPPPQLKMSQRLRLDPPRLDEVARRVRAGRPHAFAILLALQGALPPRPPLRHPALEKEEAPAPPQVRPLRHLVAYLRSKGAAGVVSLKGAGPKAGGPAVGAGGATLYAFPPGAFPPAAFLQEAQRIVGNLLEQQEHLVVVIVKDSD